MNKLLKYTGLALLAYLLFSSNQSINGMAKSKFLPLYNEDGKTNFKAAQGKAGVYLIKQDGQITYIGHSQSNLYKTMYRHFQSWKDSQYRVTYSKQGPTARIIFTTPSQAPRLETYLIKKMKPADNVFKYENITKAEETKQDNSYQEYLRAEQIPTEDLF